MMRKNRGLTLLETLLVLAIGGAIIMAAVRYFSVVHRDLNVTHAITQIQSFTKASYEWLNSQKQENFSADNNGTPISLQALIDTDLVKQSDDHKDPWGKMIIIAPGTDPNYVRITLSNVPKESCKNLTRRLDGVSKSKAESSACSGKYNQYSGEF